VADALETSGRAVLLDDRDLRAGEKFADADLIGCPVRVTVGKKTLEDGMVDVRDRATGEERRVPAQEVTV
jgi:prolyl-tRNA synthetase